MAIIALISDCNHVQENLMSPFFVFRVLRILTCSLPLRSLVRLIRCLFFCRNSEHRCLRIRSEINTRSTPCLELTTRWKILPVWLERWRLSGRCVLMKANCSSLSHLRAVVRSLKVMVNLSEVTSYKSPQFSRYSMVTMNDNNLF